MAHFYTKLGERYETDNSSFPVAGSSIEEKGLKKIGPDIVGNQASSFDCPPKDLSCPFTPPSLTDLTSSATPRES